MLNMPKSFYVVWTKQLVSLINVLILQTLS